MMGDEGLSGKICSRGPKPSDPTEVGTETTRVQLKAARASKKAGFVGIGCAYGGGRW